MPPPKCGKQALRLGRPAYIGGLVGLEGAQQGAPHLVEWQGRRERRSRRIGDPLRRAKSQRESTCGWTDWRPARRTIGPATCGPKRIAQGSAGHKPRSSEVSRCRHHRAASAQLVEKGVTKKHRPAGEGPHGGGRVWARLGMAKSASRQVCSAGGFHGCLLQWACKRRLKAGQWTLPLGFVDAHRANFAALKSPVAELYQPPSTVGRRALRP